VVSKVLLQILDKIVSKPKIFWRNIENFHKLKKKTLLTQKCSRNVKTVRRGATISTADTYLLTYLLWATGLKVWFSLWQFLSSDAKTVFVNGNVLTLKVIFLSSNSLCMMSW